MGIEAAGTGLKTVLTNTIQTNDAAYARAIYAPNELPNKLQVYPSLLILLGDSAPVTFGDAGDVDLILRLIVAFGRQDTPASANKLIDYIEQTGNFSVYAALASDRTLDGGAESSEILNNSGLITFRWGPDFYLATLFEVKCYV